MGVCLIEPHGDLTNTVLSGIPDQIFLDVVYLDMTDSEYPFGLNLFQCPHPRTTVGWPKPQVLSSTYLRSCGERALIRPG
jgi:hypothetical protein